LHVFSEGYLEVVSYFGKRAQYIPHLHLGRSYPDGFKIEFWPVPLRTITSVLISEESGQHHGDTFSWKKLEEFICD